MIDQSYSESFADEKLDRKKPVIESYFFIFPSDETTRVQLSSIRGVEGSDYINANFVDVSVFLLHVDFNKVFVLGVLR